MLINTHKFKSPNGSLPPNCLLPGTVALGTGLLPTDRFVTIGYSESSCAWIQTCNILKHNTSNINSNQRHGLTINDLLSMIAPLILSNFASS